MTETESQTLELQTVCNIVAYTGFQHGKKQGRTRSKAFRCSKSFSFFPALTSGGESIGTIPATFENFSSLVFPPSFTIFDFNAVQEFKPCQTYDVLQDKDQDVHPLLLFIFIPDDVFVP